MMSLNMFGLISVESPCDDRAVEIISHQIICGIVIEIIIPESFGYNRHFLIFSLSNESLHIDFISLQSPAFSQFISYFSGQENGINSISVLIVRRVNLVVEESICGIFHKVSYPSYIKSGNIKIICKIVNI